MTAPTRLAAACIVAALASLAHADINIGVLASLTGPGAAIGQDVKKAAELFAESAKPERINVHVVDDASDPSTGAQRLRRLIDDHQIDALVASNTTGPAMAMAQIADELKLPMVAIAPINLATVKSPWVFRASQNPAFFVERIVQHMTAQKVRSVSFIGFSDGWGDLLFSALKENAPQAGIKILAEERYKRPDPSVVAQVLKAMAPAPDAMFIGAAGAPAALPQATLRERGYKGPIYQNAVATPEFIRIGGKAAEGVMVPVGTVMVNEQLPASHPAKAPGQRFVDQYEARFGPDTRSMFAGYTWDALGMLARAGKAVQGEQPGRPVFRQKLRDILETGSAYQGATGVYAFSPADHGGLKVDSLVLVRLENGKWQLMR